MKKQYVVALTPSEWGQVCLCLMKEQGNGPLHSKICDQLPYLADGVLDSFGDEAGA